MNILISFIFWIYNKTIKQYQEKYEKKVINLHISLEMKELNEKNRVVLLNYLNFKIRKFLFYEKEKLTFSLK